MKKTLSLVVFVLCAHYFSYAQYATAGTGRLRNEIWWFDWAGMNLTNTDSKTITTPDGLKVTYTYSGVPASVPTAMIMNTWSGAVLHFLYNFTDPAIKPALYHHGAAFAQCAFTLTVTVTRDNRPVPFTFISADAEASNLLETTTLTTTGSPWQAVDFFRNSAQTSDPLRGCNSQNVSITDTYGGAAATGQNPILASTSTTGTVSVNTVMDHQAFGGMAVAFGIMAPIDRGDLPASYGTVFHGLNYTINNGCNFLAPLPAATQSQTLKLGAVAGDADGSQSLDDNATGIDEEGVSLFPAYNNNGSYSLQVALNNTTGNDAWLTSWFDVNRNAVFDNGESVTVTVPNNATNATVTWMGLPTWLPQGTTAGYGFRFRLSTDQPATQSPTGFANDGEVEDYFILSEVLCSIGIKTIGDTTVCAARPVPLTTTGTSTTTYNWDNFQYLTDVTISNPVASPLVTSRYIVTGSNPQGCYAKDTVDITVRPALAITMSNDTTICNGGAAQLTASAPGAITFAWSPQTGLSDAAIPAPVAKPGATTKYVVMATGSNGCVSEDSVTVALHPAPIFMVQPEDGTICEKDSIQLKAYGGDEYTWLAPDNSTLGISSSIIVQPAASETYRVLIKENACNITDTRSIPVVVYENPTPIISKSNDVDCSTGQAVLHVSGGSRYVWDVKPGIHINNVTSANPVVAPPQTTTYSVTVTNGKGCSAKDSITVIADFAKAINSYPVPSAFTPNKDGRNDCFGLKNWGQITELQFQVFNRWGERVFSTTNPADCWDGMFKGVLQPAGGYGYLIKAKTKCGKIDRSGMVLLIK